jgi:hypothetical protein
MRKVETITCWALRTWGNERLKKRTQKDIVKKALASLENKAEISQDGVWLPVPAEVYQKITELLRATGSGSNPLKGDWRLGILPQKHKNGKDYAVVITSANVPGIISDVYDDSAPRP